MTARQQVLGRKPKLTPAQAVEVRAWWASPRTLPEKARELGISENTLRNYIKGAHKHREVAP